MVQEKVPKVTEPPTGLDGKKMSDTKRLEVYSYHKSIVDKILLKADSL